MKRHLIAMTVASAALISAPLLAQQASTGKQSREQARQKSQGRSNASDRGRERANQNSAIADVQPGMMVHDKSGKMLGRVKEVKRAPDGTIIAIVVVLIVQINGSTQITLTPGSFTIVAGVIIVN